MNTLTISTNSSQVAKSTITTDVPTNYHQNHGAVYLTPFDLLVVCILAVLMTIGIVGNAFVIYILSRKNSKPSSSLLKNRKKEDLVRSKRSKTGSTTVTARRKWFEHRIIVLSIVDLFSSCFVPSLFIYGTLHGFRSWHFGTFGCKLLVSLFPFTVSMSQGILVCISYERYQIVETKRQPTLRVSQWLVFVVLIAGLLVSPYTYSLEMVGDAVACRSTNKPLHAAYVIGNVVRDFTSTLVMLVFSAKTIRLLRQRDQRMRRSLRKSFVNNNNNNNTSNSNCKNERNFNTSTSQYRQTSARVTRILSTMLIMFSLCVIPVDLFQFAHLVFPAQMASQLGKKGLFVTNSLLVTLQLSNSVINVFVFSSMHICFSTCCQRLPAVGKANL